MNNTTFGDESCGYYETVAGGAGAVSCIALWGRSGESNMPLASCLNPSGVIYDLVTLTDVHQAIR